MLFFIFLFFLSSLFRFFFTPFPLCSFHSSIQSHIHLPSPPHRRVGMLFFLFHHFFHLFSSPFLLLYSLFFIQFPFIHQHNQGPPPPDREADRQLFASLLFYLLFSVPHSHYFFLYSTLIHPLICSLSSFIIFPHLFSLFFPLFLSILFSFIH